MFRIIKADVSGRAPYPMAHRAGPVRPRGFPWSGGRSWRELLDEPIAIEAKDGAGCPRGLPDFFQASGMQVVSGRFASVLEALRDEVALWPASLKYAGAIRDGYFVANALNLQPSLDMARSTVRLDGVGLALTANGVALDEQRLGDAQWVKVWELQQVAVGASLQSRLLDAGLTGFSFVDPAAVRL